MIGAILGDSLGEATQADRIWLLAQGDEPFVLDFETAQSVVLDFETAQCVVREGRRESKNDRKLVPVIAWLDEQL